MISATVAGNIGQDAELRHTQGGDAVCSFSVASNRKGREGKDETTWVRCSLWGKRGSALMPFLTKGTKVAVAGSLSVRTYEKNGETKTSIELNAQDVALLGGGERAGNAPAARAPARADFRNSDAMADRGDAYEGAGDDIPF